LRLRDGKLYIEPSLPRKMEGYTVDWRAGDQTWHIRVKGDKITVNGTPYQGEGLPIYVEKQPAL